MNLAPRNNVPFEKLIVAYMIKKFPNFMEPEGSLPCSQRPIIGTYISQMNPVHNFPHCAPKIHSNIILQPTPIFGEWCVSFRLSNLSIVCI